jgi:hypothetical protein
MKPKDQKRAEGEERNTKWQALTPEQQLKDLDLRPGDCAKQRAKILKRLEPKT